ncbi:MAG: hypothetical protein HY654_04195 [Acidobacteria bacterium]|nr:hypothetical protein [Acidobacteriota bacterium]
MLCVLCGCLVRPVGAGAQEVLLDRVLAIVSGEVITLSDVRAATAFQLVTPAAAGGDPVARVVARLIERQLILNEANRYAAPDPASAAIERGLADVRQRVSAGQAVEATLAGTGMTAARLRDFIRDDLRIDNYLDQRFGGAAQPTEEEVAAYYRAHQAQFDREGLATFEQASPAARSRLREERREALVADWLERLRRRADIRELYLPSSKD